MNVIDWTQFLLFTLAIVGTPGPSNMVLMAAGAAYGPRALHPLSLRRHLRQTAHHLAAWPRHHGRASPPRARSLPRSNGPPLLISSTSPGGSLAAASPNAAAGASAPGFVQGLIVHPLNPKAWALIVGIFTTFVTPGADPARRPRRFTALGILAVQLVAQPFWMLAGHQLSRLVGGTRRPRSGSCRALASGHDRLRPLGHPGRRVMKIPDPDRTDSPCAPLGPQDFDAVWGNGLRQSPSSP